MHPIEGAPPDWQVGLLGPHADILLRGATIAQPGRGHVCSCSRECLARPQAARTGTGAQPGNTGLALTAAFPSRTYTWNLTSSQPCLAISESRLARILPANFP